MLRVRLVVSDRAESAPPAPRAARPLRCWFAVRRAGLSADLLALLVPILLSSLSARPGVRRLEQRSAGRRWGLAAWPGRDGASRGVMTGLFPARIVTQPATSSPVTLNPGDGTEGGYWGRRMRLWV